MIDHYAIARYTVQAGEAGVATFSGAYANQSGGTISLYVNDSLVNSVNVPGVATGNAPNFSFSSVALGTLNVGDTVDIAFLSADIDDLQSRNRRRFFPTGGNSGIIDVTLVPEPSAFILLGLSGLALITRRKR